jgi:hypothetical protein
VVAAVLAVIALALALEVAGSDDGHGAGKGRLVRPRPAAAALTSADVARVARRVQRLRDLRFEHPVRPLFISRERAAHMLGAATRRDYPPARRRADEESLKLIGLLAPGDSLAAALTTLDEEEVLGFYDDKRRRLVVIRERGGSRQLAEITLAHELVHALEDQRFGLRSKGAPNEDAALAESALAEGTATAVMFDYARRYFGAGDLLELLDSTLGRQADLPPYFEKVLLFPYLRGESFVRTLRGGAAGWKVVDNVLRLRHPRTTEQVIHPRKYAIEEGPMPVAMPALGGPLGDGWKRVARSSVSELDLQAWFELVGGAPDLRAAAGWGGGRFELWRRGGVGGCRAPCVTREIGAMRLAWDTSRDRGEGERALARAFLEGLKARKIADAAGATIWASRGGAIGLRGRGRETSIAFAPTPAIAAAVLDRLTLR